MFFCVHYHYLFYYPTCKPLFQVLAQVFRYSLQIFVFLKQCCTFYVQEKKLVYCYWTFNIKIIRLMTNGLLSPRLGVWGYILECFKSVILQDYSWKSSEESIYTHLKEKGSSRDYFSMLDIISPKKWVKEIFEKKS